MMPDLKNFLKSLDLTEKEITLYLASLKYGPQTASTLSKKTGLARSTVNFVFEELIKKGFASRDTKEKTTYFSVIQPESIEYILLERNAKAKKQLNDYKDLLPMLHSLQNQSSPIPKVRYYEGVEGLCRIVDVFCEDDAFVFYVSSHNNMHPKVRDYVESIYLNKSRKHKNKNKMILHDGKAAKKYVDKSRDVYDEVIFIDPEKNPLNLTTGVFNNKTVFLSYDPKDMSGIVIENQLIADHMKTIFKTLQHHFQKP